MLLTLLALAIAIGLYILQRQYTYWQRKDIPHLQPIIPFGVLDAVRRKQRSFGLALYDVYTQSGEKVLGIYLLCKPTLLVRDAHLAHQILTSDFGSFYDRGSSGDKELDLFSLRGQQWKTLRAKLTPAFTSGKLKGMFGTVNEVADKLVQHLNGRLEGKQSETIEMKELLTTYAVDVIASVIFGLEVDSFTDPNNEFRLVSSRFLKANGPLDIIRGLAGFLFPKLANFLVYVGLRDPNITKIREIAQRTVEYREKHNVSRKDLLQLLIQLRNTGKISDETDKMWEVETVAEELKSLSIELLSAQTFLFFIAGTETTSATAAYTLYHLSMDADLLKRAQDEVEEVLQRHGIRPSEQFSYEAVKDMKFMDLCIMETTRLYPGLPFLNRECTKDFQVPGTKHVIEKGTPVLISLFGIHRDPAYFPDPEKYDPDRFTEENRNYDPVAYMPFGEGPKMCIAKRMGEVNAKLAIAKILANYDITPKKCEPVEFIFQSAPILTAKGGLQIRLSKKKL